MQFEDRENKRIKKITPRGNPLQKKSLKKIAIKNYV